MKINSREELNHLQEYYSSRLNAQKKEFWYAQAPAVSQAVPF